MKMNLNLYYFFIHTIFCFKQYRNLKKAFDPFKNKGLIQFGPHNLYIHGYLSKSYPVKSRILIGTFHYNFIHYKFKGETIDQLFHNGITCWHQRIDTETYKVLLKKEDYEGEGSLSLLFYVNDLLLYFLRFSIGPNLKNPRETVIHLGTIQGTRNIFDIKKAIEYFDDIYPPKILMTIIESVAQVFGINTIIGVSRENQLSYKRKSSQSKIHFMYESFYESFGGERHDNGYYFISCPFPHRPITLIKQKHRRRALVKRNKLQEISHISSALLTKSINEATN